MHRMEGGAAASPSMPMMHNLLALLLLQPPSSDINSLPEPQSPPQAPAPRPTGPRGTAHQRGLDMLIPGGILTGIAIPMLVVGAIDVDKARRCEPGHECFVPAVAGALNLYVGGLLLAIGLPLLGIGVHRLRVWRRWQRQNGITLRPTLAPARHTASVGLELRF